MDPTANANASATAYSTFYRQPLPTGVFFQQDNSADVQKTLVSDECL